MKRITIIILILLVLGGVYYYISRPVAEPSLESDANMQEEIREGKVTYSIESQNSKAQFEIDEVLRGEDFTAVGVTSDIQGNIFVDLDDMAKTEISEIKVNARTLKTDSENRDGAIARLILDSEKDENEYIVFNPKSISGLPDGSFNGSFEFSIIGDLTVSGVTKEVVFSGEVITINEETITAEASTVVNRADFDLTIPDLPFLASVDDEVRLKLNIVASPK